MSQELPFELASRAYEGELRPVELFVREHVNAPFEVRARIQAPPGDAAQVADALFEARTTVRLPTPLGMRSFHGLVASTEILTTTADGWTAVELLIVPRLDLLRHKKQARIFQEMSTSAIVSRIVGEVDQRIEVRVASELSKRVYVCQYHETDLSFVERILAEDGLFYWFEHDEEEETMVVADSADAYRPIAGDPMLVLRPAGADDAMTLEERHLTALSDRKTLRTKGTVRRDFDVLRPRLPLSARHSTGGPTALLLPEAEREAMRRDLTHDVHLGSREETRVLGVPPARHTEALRVTSAVFSGTTVCRRMGVGRTFRVEGRDRDVAEEMVALSVEHHARITALADGGVTYEVTYEAVPAQVPMRPPPRSLKPTAIHETATIVGAEGQQIHTDELGRVKVQFHWDRDGALDDRSSCWLRVQQPWSGPGFGAQFIPRVGTEVLVGFIGGDPDRPIVTGSLYNATSPFPFSLPADKEKAGFRSQSTGPGDGGGCHELVFDDTRGSEMVSLRSQNALRVLSVGPSLTEVGTDAARRVAGSVADEIGGAYGGKISGPATLRVDGATATRLAGPARLDIAQGADISIDGNATQHFGGNVYNVVDQTRTTIVGTDKNNPSLDTTSVQGSSRLSASHEITFEAHKTIVLRCGKSTLRILPDRIVLDTESLHLQGKKHVSAVQGEKGGVSWALDGDFAIEAGTVSLASKKGATLRLDADASLDGTFVRLNCGGDADAAKERVVSGDGRARVVFRLLRDDLPPGVTEATLVISGPGGETFERTCAAGGEVTIEGAVGEPYALVEVRVGDEVIDVRRVNTPNDKGGSRG